MNIELLKLETEEKMENTINQYLDNIIKINVGRANPRILDRIKINYFNTLTPINQISQITVPEANQILIKPYDRTINKQIVSAINSSSLGFNGIDEDDKIRISFPETTKERRIELTKSLNKYTEQARIQVRSARQEANKAIKAIADFPEDDEKRELEAIQKLTDRYIAKIDQETKNKEHELMTI